eukprot:gene7321-8715_t
MTGNSADYGAAVSLPPRGQCYLEASEVADNRATSEGAAAHLDTESCLHVGSGSMLAGNVADGSGGAIYMNQLARTEVSGGSALRANRARVDGGAVYLQTSALMHCRDCALTSNVAETGSGGAAWCASSATVDAQNSTWTGNDARGGLGGALLVSSNASAVRLRDSTFEGNVAEQGGAMYLVTPARETVFELAAVHFARNNASLGPNVFWDYHANAQDPGCENCTVEASDANGTSAFALASSPKTFAVAQDCAVIEQAITAESGGSIRLTYFAYDFYGRPTWTVGINTVITEAAESSTLLAGSTLALYASEGGAVFDDLRVTAQPGTVATLSFQPQYPTWEAVQLPIHMAQCAVGSRYLEAAQICELCSQDSVKFRGGGGSGEECPSGVEGIQCPGGSSYELLDGYWLGEQAARKCSEVDEDERELCVVNRLAKCDVASSCSSELPRGNAEGELHVSTQALCAEGYADDVALCGACEAGYENVGDGTCHQCPVDSWRTWLQAALVVAAIAGVAAMAVFLAGQYRLRSVQQSSDMQARLDFGNNLNNDASSARGAISIWSGWLQVTAQTAAIYDGDVLPGVYRTFVQFLDLFNVNFFTWTRSECLAYSLLGDRQWPGVGGFYWTFLLYALIPVALGPSSIRMLLRVLALLNSAQGDGIAMQGSPLGGGAKPRGQSSGGDGSAGCGEVSLLLHRRGHTTAPEKAERWWEQQQDKTAAEGGQPQHKVGEAAEEAAEEEAEEEGHQGRRQEQCQKQEVEVAQQQQQQKEDVKEEKEEGQQYQQQQQQKEEEEEEGTAEEEEEEGRAVKGEESARSAGHSSNDGTVASTSQGSAGQRLALFFIIFFQPTVATQMLQLFNCDPIYHNNSTPDYFLALDREVACYSRTWWVFAAVALAILLTYVIGLPLGLLFILRKLHCQKRVYTEHGTTCFVPSSLMRRAEDGSWLLRVLSDEQGKGGTCVVFPTEAPDVDSDALIEDKAGIFNMLDLPEAHACLGAVYLPFRRRFSWVGGSYEMFRRLLQCSFLVIIRMCDRKMDVFFSLLVAVSSLTIQAYHHPYRDAQNNMLQTLILYIQCLTVTVFIATEYVSEDLLGSVGGGVLLAVQMLLQIVVIYVLAGVYGPVLKALLREANMLDLRPS